MTRPDLHKREWRDLPRDGECVAEFLFGEAAGPCRGLMHRHHVVPRDPTSRTYLACARHHPTLEAFLRRLTPRPYKRHVRNHNGCRTCDGHRMVQLSERGPEVWGRCPACNPAHVAA